MAQESSDRSGITVAKVMWRWGGGLIGVSLSAGARHIIGRSGEVILQAVGVAIMVGGIGIALIWLWHLVWERCPRQRFRAKAELFENTMQGLHDDHPERQNSSSRGPASYSSPKTKALLHQTIHELDKLSVPHPRFAYKVNRWIIFLERVLADSNIGKLETAKTRWCVMKRDDGDSDDPA